MTSKTKTNTEPLTEKLKINKLGGNCAPNYKTNAKKMDFGSQKTNRSIAHEKV